MHFCFLQMNRFSVSLFLTLNLFIVLYLTHFYVFDPFLLFLFNKWNSFCHQTEFCFSRKLLWSTRGQHQIRTDLSGSWLLMLLFCSEVTCWTQRRDLGSSCWTPGPAAGPSGLSEHVSRDQPELSQRFQVSSFLCGKWWAASVQSKRWLQIKIRTFLF